MKLGNADGGKASTKLSPLLGTHLLHSVVGITNGNKTSKDSRISNKFLQEELYFVNDDLEEPYA